MTDKNPRFGCESFDGCDKTIFMFDSESDFSWRVDYDDVDHDEVKKKVKKMLDLLNKHWDDKV